MKSLYLRIWLTVLAALSLFALASGWLVQRHMAQERERFEVAAQGRAEEGLSDAELQARAGAEARRLRHFIPA